MLQAEVNGYVCKSTQNYEVLYSVLEDITLDDTASIQAMNQRKLTKTIKSCDNLICYSPSGDAVGACVYTTGLNGIELIHMYVVPKYRVSYGSALLNHYLINIIGDGKEVWLKSGNTSSFNKVVEETKMLDVYTITDRARDGLKKMLADKVIWKEI